jgi:hypothetical protein
MFAYEFTPLNPVPDKYGKLKPVNHSLSLFQVLCIRPHAPTTIPFGWGEWCLLSVPVVIWYCIYHVSRKRQNAMKLEKS